MRSWKRGRLPRVRDGRAARNRDAAALGLRHSGVARKTKRLQRAETPLPCGERLTGQARNGQGPAVPEAPAGQRREAEAGRARTAGSRSRAARGKGQDAGRARGTPVARPAEPGPDLGGAIPLPGSGDPKGSPERAATGKPAGAARLRSAGGAAGSPEKTPACRQSVGGSSARLGACGQCSGRATGPRCWRLRPGRPGAGGPAQAPAALRPETSSRASRRDRPQRSIASVRIPPPPLTSGESVGCLLGCKKC